MTSRGRGRQVKQGDILLVSLDPAVGSEIQGKRPVLVLSNSEFHRGGWALVAAITQGANFDRVRGWAVPLMGTGTEIQGALVLSQCHSQGDSDNPLICVRAEQIGCMLRLCARFGGK